VDNGGKSLLVQPNGCNSRRQWRSAERRHKLLAPNPGDGTGIAQFLVVVPVRATWLLRAIPRDFPKGQQRGFAGSLVHGGWSQGQFRLPRGEWILQWRPFEDYWFSYGSSNTLWLDEVSFVPGEVPCHLDVASEGDHGDDASFRVNLEGAVDQPYTIEVSTDLQHWIPLTRVTCYGFHGQFSDWNSGAAARFYRAKPAESIVTHRAVQGESMSRDEHRISGRLRGFRDKWRRGGREWLQ